MSCISTACRYIATRIRATTSAHAQSLLRQQSLDRRLRFGVIAFAEVRVDHLSFPVDQVERGPILVVVRTPRRVLVVLRDRVRDVETLEGGLHVFRAALER